MSNVHLLRADVANLAVRDDAVDIVLSMAGLHAFADKRRDLTEMNRVVRELGTLLACRYFKGVRWVRDWLVNHIAARRGYFTPPFLHVDAIASELEGFTIRRQGNVKSIAWFEAV